MAYIKREGHAIYLSAKRILKYYELEKINNSLIEPGNTF